MKATTPLPSRERLHELFEITSDGFPVRRSTASNGRGGKAGEVAGTVRGDGYRRIRIDGLFFYWHRLVLQMHGIDPAGFEVDHINGNPIDNLFSNLRVLTTALNAQNQCEPPAHNTSGYLGVSSRKDGRWLATIKVDGKQRYLGLYATPETAHTAYLAAKASLHPAAVMSRFAA